MSINHVTLAVGDPLPTLEYELISTYVPKEEYVYADTSDDVLTAVKAIVNYANLFGYDNLFITDRGPPQPAAVDKYDRPMWEGLYSITALQGDQAIDIVDKYRERQAQNGL